jgi:signal transduction histidine kinase
MESVGRLAGGIAHDFNNLLTVINGTAELVMGEVSADSPLREDLRQIEQAGGRAAALTQQLLAFSRRQILKPVVLNLGTVVLGMRDMLQRLIGEEIRLEVSVADGLGSVRADPGQIEQVVMNLVVNARDAMKGGGTLTIDVRNVDIDGPLVQGHAMLQAGPHVLLSLTDSGTGMDEATRLRIFEPFFTTKGPTRGTGLGLSTVYGIVQQSAGSIRVSSEPGQGTCFELHFPRVDEPVPPVARRRPRRCEGPRPCCWSKTSLACDRSRSASWKARATP